MTGLKIGDRVWTWDAAWERAEGTAQEYLSLPAKQVVPLPDNASFDVGASMGIPALTVHRALTAHRTSPLQLKPGVLTGFTVVVAGGAGAVGHAAIQLAICECSTAVHPDLTDPDAKMASVRAVSAAIADGAMGVGEQAGLPVHRYPLERTADAHRASEEGVVGRVLIDVHTSS